MASLNTLRTKYGIVLSVVIALVLVAFILGDQLSMQNRTNAVPEDKTVITVNGEEIKASEYAKYQEIFRDANLSDDNKSDYAYQTAIYNAFTKEALEQVGAEIYGIVLSDLKVGKVDGKYGKYSKYSKYGKYSRYSRYSKYASYSRYEET